MALSISFDGTLLLQLTEEARPTPVPVKYQLTYTKKVMWDFSNTTTVTNLAVPQAGVVHPRFILVFIREGEIDLSWESDGDGATTVGANPQGGDVPVMILFRQPPDASTQLYLSSTGVARGAIWLFE